MCMRLKNWEKESFTEPFSSFGQNTNKLYILKHCINIVFILQKNNIKPQMFKVCIKKYNLAIIP